MLVERLMRKAPTSPSIGDVLDFSVNLVFRIIHLGKEHAAQALFGELSWDVTILTVLYSIAGLGIAIVNDFKSIEGDACVSSH